jgi:hypothetical protein
MGVFSLSHKLTQHSLLAERLIRGTFSATALPLEHGRTDVPFVEQDDVIVWSGTRRRWGCEGVSQSDYEVFVVGGGRSWPSSWVDAGKGVNEGNVVEVVWCCKYVEEEMEGIGGGTISFLEGSSHDYFGRADIEEHPQLSTKRPRCVV